LANVNPFSVPYSISLGGSYGFFFARRAVLRFI
jgi:hypothetical protein